MKKNTPEQEPRQYPVWAVLTFTGVIVALLTVGDIILRSHPVAGRTCLFLAGGILLVLLLVTAIQEQLRTGHTGQDSESTDPTSDKGGKDS